MTSKPRKSKGGPKKGSKTSSNSKSDAKSQKPNKTKSYISDRQKTARQQINDKANKLVSAGLNRIELKKQLKEVNRLRAEQSTQPPTQPSESPPSKLKSQQKSKSASTTTTTTTTTATTSHTHHLPPIYQSGRTVIVGDGDFSFTASLLQHRAADPHNIISTTYDTYNQVKAKYHDTYSKHLDYIHLGPTIVLNSIDATHFENHFPNQFTTQNYPSEIKPSPLQSVIKMPYPFDRILFNFPHTGEQRVHINRALLLDFFTSARPHLALPAELTYSFGHQFQQTQQRNRLDGLLDDVKGRLLPYITETRKQYSQPQNTKIHKKDPKQQQKEKNQPINRFLDPFGRVVVVLRDGDPYDGWEIDVQAATALYQLEQKLPWEPSLWKFYSHKTTDVSHNALEGGKAHIYIFKLTNIGVAMALKEQANLSQLQSTRLEEHYNHHKADMAQSLSNRVGIEQLLHLSQWQNRAIVKAQNKVKTALNKANHVAVGTLSSTDLPLPTKRALLSEDNSDAANGIAFQAFSAEKIAQMTSRLDQFVSSEATITATAKKTKKGKKEVEQVVEPIVKKQRVDHSLLAGIDSKHRSMSLLDQLDGGLVQLDPLPTSKEESKTKKQPKQIETEPSESNLFGQFNLADILAMEAVVAPEISQKRLRQEADEKARVESAKIAQADAQAKAKRIAEEKAEKSRADAELEAKLKAEAETSKIAADREKKRNEQKVRLEKRAAKRAAEAAGEELVPPGKQSAEAKTDATTATKQKGAKWDFKQSDDVDLSREIFAMLNGETGIKKLSAINTLKDNDDSGSDDDDDNDLDAQFAAFKLPDDSDDGFDYGQSDDDDDDDDGDDFQDDDSEDQQPQKQNATKTSKQSQQHSALAALKEATKLLAASKPTPATAAKTAATAGTAQKSTLEPTPLVISSGFSGFGTDGISGATAKASSKVASSKAPLKAVKTTTDESPSPPASFSGFGTGGLAAVKGKKVAEKTSKSAVEKTVKEPAKKVSIEAPVKVKTTKKNTKGIASFGNSMQDDDNDDHFAYGHMADDDDLFPIKKVPIKPIKSTKSTKPTKRANRF